MNLLARHAELVSASPETISSIVTATKRCRNKFGMTCKAVEFFTKLFCEVNNIEL
jgi:hypothetical protein